MTAFYYDKAKLPFSFTPHIFRYLEKLVDITNNTWADETDEEVSIENYLPGEPKNQETEINNGAFWDFLEKIGAIKINKEKGVQGLKPGMKVEIEVVESSDIKTFYLPKTYLHILDTKKIEKLLKDREAKTILRPEALELIARDIAEQKTGPKLVDFLRRCDVPIKLIIYPNTKWKTLYDVFRVLNTSENNKAHKILYKIIEAAVHPLFFDGDENKATEAEKKYNEWLKYDRIELKHRKLYIGPTDEEWDLGIIEWRDADGNAIEPKGVFIFPDELAKLWVLWSQLIILVSAYENNKALDQKVLEKLYLEIIDGVEKLLHSGELGNLPETYKRPFTSLTTAYIEAKAKQADSASDLVNTFLLKITALKPNPTEIGKEIEKKSELIQRVTEATRAISGEEIKFAELSHEQALFLLKIFMRFIFRMLEAVSTGYIAVADERLNAQYVLLLDNLNGILERDDFEEMRKELPQDLPEHLLVVEDMDTWWECGGQTQMMDFVGKIESAWVRMGQQTFPIPGWLVQNFNVVDEAITEHVKNKTVQWNKMMKNIDERKARGEFSFDEPQKKQEKKTGNDKVIGAIEDAMVRGFNNMFTDLQEHGTAQKIEITAMPEVPVRFVGDDMKKPEDKPSALTLKSIHLITNSLEPKDTIWMVLNELFEMPIRFAVRNSNGEPSAIKKLYDIAYYVDAPNKRVSYDKKVADGINNGLFKKAEVAKFMKTNKLEKPTLVKKSEDDVLLVLSGRVLVLPGLIKNVVPLQYQSIYIDKTR